MVSELTSKVGYIVAVIGLPMAAGYLLRRWLLWRTDGEQTSRRWSRRLKFICVTSFVPPIAVTAMIRRPLAGTEVVCMAGLGVFCLLAGALIGRIYIAARSMPIRRAGAFLGCTAMANLVAFGGLVTFIFWGNAGLQHLFLFKLLEHVLYFGVFYPWCSTFSPDLKPTRFAVIASFRNHPVTLIPITAVVAGLICNFALYKIGEPATGPPTWTLRVNVVLVPIQVGLLTFAVGLALRPSRVAHDWPECLAASLIKFVIRPAISAAGAFVCLQLGWINDLAFCVVVLLSAMPVAFNALIPPTLYHLDEDLANSCWIVTTALMIVVVPVLYVILM